MICFCDYAFADKWLYSEDLEKMSGKVTKFATVYSESPLNLKFPYEGEQYLKLNIRKHPKYGNEVYLTIDKGQFQCGVYDCAVSVKFDNNKEFTVQGSRSSDNDSTVLFLKESAKLIKGLLKAKRTLIQVTFHQNGSPVMEFNTENFKFE